MRRLIAVAIVAVLAAFALNAHAVTIAWAPVRDAGNANDTNRYFGAVPYNYSIDKYDVTIGQYTEFLNAVAATDTYGLYNTSMATDLHVAGIARSGESGTYTYNVIGFSATLPITYVSWGDAARFANWLQNGQRTGPEGPGTTETGAYTLNGAVTDAQLLAVKRNIGATIVLPSESEWYKAAFYNPATRSYYTYPTSSNTPPTSAQPASTPNTANYVTTSGIFAVTNSGSFSAVQNYLSIVGQYSGSASPYGAFDMGGNVWQWNEGLIASPSRSLRGSSWHSTINVMSSVTQLNAHATDENEVFGFRVATIPEPSSGVLAAFGLAGLAAWRWRMRSR